MTRDFSRRRFLGTVSLGLGAGAAVSSELWAASVLPAPPAGSGAAAAAEGAFPATFPQHAPEVARQVVGDAHSKLDSLREAVTARPSLANAAYDWGFGDWETAIGAASHMGRRDIAEFLLSQGARPDVFTLAMLGSVAGVRAAIEVSPGLQRTRGPHGISLLQHARAGGDAAKGVLAYLESLGDADPRYRDEPLTETERASLLGEYAAGDGANDRLIVKEGMGSVTLGRPGSSGRRLFHQGGLVFHPGGAPHVRVRFEAVTAGGAIERVSVDDAGVVVTARRTKA